MCTSNDVASMNHGRHNTVPFGVDLAVNGIDFRSVSCTRSPKTHVHHRVPMTSVLPEHNCAQVPHQTTCHSYSAAWPQGVGGRRTRASAARGGNHGPHHPPPEPLLRPPGFRRRPPATLRSLWLAAGGSGAAAAGADPVSSFKSC